MLTAWPPLAGMAVVMAACGLLLGAVAWWKRVRQPPAELTRKAVHVGMGVIALALPWLFARTWPVLALTHWPEFRAQFGMHQARFDLLNLAFYVNNIMAEGQRYFLGVQQPGTLGRLGFWLVVVGLPLALFWLGRTLEQLVFLRINDLRVHVLTVLFVVGAALFAAPSLIG